MTPKERSAYLQASVPYFPWLLAMLYDKHRNDVMTKTDIKVAIEYSDISMCVIFANAMDFNSTTEVLRKASKQWLEYNGAQYRMTYQMISEYDGGQWQYKVERREMVIDPPAAPAAPDLDALIDRILRRQEARTLRSLTMSRALQALIVRLDAALDADEPTLRATVREVLDDLGHAVTWGDERGAA